MSLHQIPNYFELITYNTYCISLEEARMGWGEGLSLPINIAVTLDIAQCIQTRYFKSNISGRFFSNVKSNRIFRVINIHNFKLRKRMINYICTM